MTMDPSGFCSLHTTDEKPHCEHINSVGKACQQRIALVDGFCRFPQKKSEPNSEDETKSQETQEDEPSAETLLETLLETKEDIKEDENPEEETQKEEPVIKAEEKDIEVPITCLGTTLKGDPCKQTKLVKGTQYCAKHRPLE